MRRFATGAILTLGILSASALGAKVVPSLPAWWQSQSAEVGNDVQATRSTVAPAELSNPSFVGRSVPISIERGDDGGLAMVSMTPIGNDRYLAVNYRNVYLIDLRKNTARVVPLQGQVPVWMPTAIDYSPFYNRVYVANYSGNDVIVSEFKEGSGGAILELKERLTFAEASLGVEGIEISKGGRYMALASNDGHLVSVLERTAGAWKLRWSEKLKSAHGLSFAGDVLYASGLSIAKFDVESGRRLAEQDHLGSDPVRFVTCLEFDEQSGVLLGTDTIAGNIFALDEDLVLLKKIGTNGPTYSNLSMPYCAYRDGSSLLVLSTYQERIVRLSESQTLSYEMSGRNWSYIDSGLPQLKFDRAQWSGFAKLDHPRYMLFDRSFSPGYGRLMSIDLKLRLPIRNRLFSDNWPSYVSSLAQSGPWAIIASNSSTSVIMMNNSTMELAYLETGEWDCWAIHDELWCPSRKYRVEELLERAKLITPKPTLAELAASLSLTADTLNLEFETSAGKRFLKDLGAKKDVHLAALDYFKSVAGKQAPLVEYWIVSSMLRANSIDTSSITR